ncbi:MAG: GAF domain-containing protein [Thermodesulfobacteriota bacterium]|nr:GAF domain-containing protein [Thermodesulfobacteriota bacterium]
MRDRTKPMNQTFRYKYAIVFGLTSVLPLLLFLLAVEHYGIVQEGRVAVLLGGSLILALVGLTYSLRIVRQVNALAQDFVKVERGDLDALGERTTSSEINEMSRIADSFNKTLSHLKTHAGDLENLFGKLNTLSELIGLVSRIPNIKEVLQIVLHRTMAALNARIGSIMLLDDESQTLKITCAEGLDESIVAQTILRLGERIAGKVALSGEAVLVEDVERDPRLRKANDPKYESSSFICMPLRVRGRVMGVLNLSKRGDRRAFSQSDMTFLTSLLGHIGFALENAKLIEEAKGAAKQLEQVVRDQCVQLNLVQKQVAKSTKLFQQAQKMEAVGTLAGGIAHDFNNILMGIQGRTSVMLMEMEAGHPHHARLRAIEDMAKKGSELTKQLLSFARGGEYEVKPTDLNRLVKEQNQLVSRTKKEITLHEKHAKNLWVSEVDPVQIEQVLLNIYLNAWQAMPDGGDLFIQTENCTLDENFVKPFQVKPGKYVRISVTDTGVGMDEETRHRVFEPFFTTKEAGDGTGLGLASAYGIIKNHGGIINVQSELGHGTTFDIYLPACDKEVSEEKEPRADVLRGTETILLVDDEDAILDVGKEMLTALGYKVVSAQGGKMAVGVYAEHKEEIDLVILDMIMPEMAGGEVYDRIREINPHARALLSSGYGLDGRVTDILDRGCSGFIQKPFDLKDLSERIREVLEGA